MPEILPCDAGISGTTRIHCLQLAGQAILGTLFLTGQGTGTGTSWSHLIAIVVSPPRIWRGIYFRCFFFFFRFFLGFFFAFGFLASWLLGFLASWLLGFLASRLLGFLASWLLGFLASWLLGFLAFRLLGFLASRLLGFWASWLLGFLASWLLGFSASWLLGFWASRLFGFLLVYAAFGGFLAFRILCIPSSSSAGGVFPTSWGGLPPPPTPPLRFRFSAEIFLVAPLFESSLFRASNFARKCCKIRHFR